MIRCVSCGEEYDFLKMEKNIHTDGNCSIVTNPPYKYAQELTNNKILITFNFTFYSKNNCKTLGKGIWSYCSSSCYCIWSLDTWTEWYRNI